MASRPRPSLRRAGGRSIVDHDGCTSASVQSRLDEVGSGRYQLLLLLAVGGAHLSECVEMGSVAPLHTAIARSYGLSRWQRSALPTATFLGSGFGLLLAGPLCDWKGRKGILVLSLSTIAAVMLCTALLPARAGIPYLLALRFLSGMAGAVQVPAGLVLAVESSPSDDRPRMVFGVQLLGALGYLLEAAGVMALMPSFGEEPSDRWRMYVGLTGMLPLLALPLTALLRESPSFLAVQGDADGCVRVLDHIARCNGKRPMRESTHIPAAAGAPLAAGGLAAWSGRQARAEGAVPDVAKHVPPLAATEGRQLGDVAGVMGSLLVSNFTLVLLLCMIDSSRSFFVSGSAYLWKDLFQLVDDSRGPSPGLLNVLSSIAPLVGIGISERLLGLGVRTITFLSSALAVFALAALTNEYVRSSSWRLLACALVVKFTYGPLVTCISLIKAESFPTEVRVSAYSLVSVCAKLLCMLGPLLVEALKGTEKATSWRPSTLGFYILFLMSSVLLCGLLTFIIPGRTGDGKRLRDFFEHRPARLTQSTSFSSFDAMWDLRSESDSDAGSPSPRMPRSATEPNLHQRGPTLTRCRVEL